MVLKEFLHTNIYAGKPFRIVANCFTHISDTVNMLLLNNGTYLVMYLWYMCTYFAKLDDVNIHRISMKF